MAARSYSRKVPTSSWESETWTPGSRAAISSREQQLVLGVGVGVQQHDRDRLRLAPAQRSSERGRAGRSSGASTPLGGRALRRAEAQLRGGASGGGGALAQPVEVGPRLAAQLDQVGEALGRDQRRARDAPLSSAFVATVMPCAKRVTAPAGRRPRRSTAASASITARD